MKKRPEKLDRLLESTFAKLGIPQLGAELQIREKWEYLVGKRAASLAVVERFSGGKLYVRVKDGTWRMELNFQRQTLLHKIRRELDLESVEEIIFL